MNREEDISESTGQWDPIEGLKQLEKFISEAKEFDSKQKNNSFNGNKLLNELLDKPINNSASNNDNENVDEEEEAEDDSDEDVEENNEQRGKKRSIDQELEEGVSEQHNNDNSGHKSTPNSKGKNKNKRKKGSKSKNPQLRKNIKSILTETELDKETLAARKEEEERMARQKERAQQRLQEIQIQSQLSTAFNPFGTHSNNSNNHMESYNVQEVLVLSSDEEDNTSSLQNRISKPNASSSAEIIDLSSGDEESDATTYRPQYNQYSSGVRLDYNMVGAYDTDDVAIIDDNMDGMPPGSEENYEDLNNCGSHTDDSLNTPDSDGRVLVNVAHPPGESDIYLAPQIARAVKPHQIGGIRFLYDNVVESLDQFNKSAGFGCILSHSMGLGKTMQVISFVDVFLSHTSAKYVLCIVPINTLQNWISEFNMWLPDEENMDKYLKKDNNNCDVKYRKFKVFALNEAKSMTARAKEILSWRKFGGVLLLGYEMYRILTSNNKKKSTKDDDINPQVLSEINKELQTSLIDPGPDLIVCDEGHRIKNCNAATSLALKNIKTKRRIVLTGYPLQNNLIEYWCMVDFVRPNYLGLKAEFTNMFERPIVNGQCSDSTPHDRKLMRYRAHVLFQLLKGFVQRRSHSVLKRALPLKCEYVFLCRMTKIQKELMLAFLDTAINDPNSIGTASGRISTLLLFSVCCKIWNHPDIVYDIVRKGISSDDLDIDIPAKNKKLPKNKRKSRNGLTSNIESLTLQQSSSTQFLEPTNNLFDAPLRPRNEGVIDYSWSEQLLSQYKPGVIENSYKMIVLFEIIEETISCGDRLLIFSQSLFTLDLIERFLQSREVPKSKSKWCRNQTYYRLDGSTSGQEREKYINQFNDRKIAHLFLISTRAGSLGINLIGANRIVIFDASWNPCHDAQAACRIYRYGQSKPCFIYRLICDNSLEKKIYDRQVNKQGMANRVVDEQNVETNFTWREIHSLLDDLHEINEPPIQDFSEEELSKYGDHLIKHLCTKLNHCITRTPFEHESLLLDCKETKLTNSEKKIAEWQYNMAKQAKQLDRQWENNGGYGSVRSQLHSRVQSNHLNTPYYMPSTPVLPSQITPTPNCFYDMSPYPDISQPLPPYPPQPRVQPPPPSFQNFESIAETLVRNGNSVKKVRIPKDINISISPSNTINIRKGEEVMVIKTHKGLYLRTSDGNIISIKNSSNLDNSLSGDSLSSFIPMSNNDSFGIIQPNLHCGGTVHCTPSHSRATSTVSHVPEVVQLSDDDDESQDDLGLDSNLNSFNANTMSTCSEPSVRSNDSIAIESSLSYIPIDNETLPTDATQSASNSYSNMDSIESLSTSTSYSHPNTSLTSDCTFSTSTPNPKRRLDLHGFESSPSTAAYGSYSQSTPSSQVNGSSINLEA